MYIVLETCDSGHKLFNNNIGIIYIAIRHLYIGDCSRIMGSVCIDYMYYILRTKCLIFV